MWRRRNGDKMNGNSISAAPLQTSKGVFNQKIQITAGFPQHSPHSQRVHRPLAAFKNSMP